MTVRCWWTSSMWKISREVYAACTWAFEIDHHAVSGLCWCGNSLHGWSVHQPQLG
ncbi:hypothetical protein [Stenotrophomonas phage CM2]